MAALHGSYEMNSSRLSIIVGVSLILLAHPASAQSPAPKPKAHPDSAAERGRPAAPAEADLIRKGRQEQARALLFALGSDARSFRDLRLCARSLARVADALWDVAADQGRILFREAWEAAETADRESQEPINLRGEVLRLAARRDPLLAEAFLQKMKVEQQEAKADLSGNNPTSGDNLWELPEPLEKRLSLAENLLSAGDTERALQFADPVLGAVTISTVDFLTLLREKSPAAADRRYAAMLANTGGNVLADANTISVLASYLFTPRTYVIFNAQGAPEFSSMPWPAPANVAPQLRLAFFQTAGRVFLRPQPSAEQAQRPAVSAVKYMVFKRLLPLFEQYAPKEIRDVMRGQFEALDAVAGSGLRQSESEWVRKGITPEKEVTADQEQALLEQIERAKSSDERDDLYFKLASLARGKDDLKARDYVSKISDGEFRKQAQAWVDWGLAVNAIRKKKTETALELARSEALTHIQRVWVLTQASKLTLGTDRDKASALLNEATTEARRVEDGTPDRPRGLLAVANALLLIEPSRAWEATFEAIKAANSTEGFTGEGGVLVLTVSRKGQILGRKFEHVPDFDIQGIFAKLARSDYEWAVQLARAFQGEAPRVNATIAVTRAVLSEKPPAPQPATKN
jgi:hypothetical protein